MTLTRKERTVSQRFQLQHHVLQTSHSVSVRDKQTGPNKQRETRLAEMDAERGDLNVHLVSKVRDINDI